MYRIFIIEDDAAMAAAIKKQVEAWGNEAKCAACLSDILPEFIAFDPHLVMVDIMLPFYNGYHWCTEIRRISAVPVIFISSASDNMNIVMAMNMGGDDFVAKPFDLAVLTAKMQALLRRTYDLGNRIPVMEHGGVVLNLHDSTVVFSGKQVELTRNEFRILSALMEIPGKIVSRETLMQRLWESDIYVEENTLTVNINRLRKKLAEIGLEHFIHTKQGQGYLIER